MSAPKSPGVFKSAKASKSVPIIMRPPFAWISLVTFSKSSIEPSAFGYWKYAAKYSFPLSGRSPISISTPSGFARDLIIAIVCLNVLLFIKKVLDLLLATLLANIIASAAEVGSSSNDALEISIPVKSETIVW